MFLGLVGCRVHARFKIWAQGVRVTVARIAAECPTSYGEL